MNLEALKKELPFKWRVQSTNQYGCTCVAYIDARDVQDLLDDVCGQDGWQVKYEEHKGNLFASIGIKEYFDNQDKDSKTTLEDWVWKSDCGTESQVEKQKGEASDAFKRAAVMWGVGRFLYSLKIIKIKEVINKNNKFFPAQNGKQIWDVNEYCNNIHKGNKPKLEGDKFNTALQKFNKTQLQTVLDTYDLTEIQVKAIKLTKAFTNGSK